MGDIIVEGIKSLLGILPLILVVFIVLLYLGKAVK